MKFPRHWAKGSVEVPGATGAKHRFTAWGWSDDSPREAERVGRERAARAGQAVLRGDPVNRYLYGDRPVREEVIEEIADAEGVATMVITRNAYGCHVLNCSQAMFVDIDEPAPTASASIRRGLARLFGRAKRSAEDDWQTAALARVEAWCGADAQAGARIYRTRAGLRILATHGPAEPASDATHAVMESLGSDPLYMRLCRLQESFRARLTPKPWRCGVPSPTIRYPWPDQAAETEFRAWEQRYRAAAEPYATCCFLQTIGNEQIHPGIAPVIALHDRMTQTGSNAPLA